jgi:hypothetical protein
MIPLRSNIESQAMDYLVPDTLGTNMESHVMDYLVHDNL